jgi:hypothetical protein
LELKRTTWKRYNEKVDEENAVVERNFQAMEPYKERD